MTELRISETFAFPLELITDRAMVLATTGAGKTYLERVITEEVLEANQQCVVLDPKGDFWGLRASADGKKPGYSIPVFGGEHADLPLEEGSGEFIAELIVRERLSAILDMSLFSKTKMLAWATDFAEALYHRNREAMMLVIDELHTFAPQKFKGHERMLGAFTDLFGKGRKRGIGTLGASQRSALVNKDVLDLTATMFFLRTGSPRDRDVVDAWLEYNADTETRRAIMEDLPKMENGEVWVYSPHSFKVLERMQVREARTFDSSATPKPGKAIRKPKTLAEIDVEGVVEQMQGAIERAKADDPAELKKTITTLRKNLRRLAESKAPTTEQVEVRVEVPVEVPVMDKKDRDHIWAVLKDLGSQFERIEKKLDEATKVGTRKRTSLESRKPAVARSPRSAAPSPRAVKDTRPDRAPATDSDFIPSKPQQKVLDAIAWCNAVGIPHPKRQVVAAIAGVSSRSSGFDKNCSTLRTNGYLEYPDGGRLELTDIGAATSRVPDIPPDEAMLQKAIFQMVGQAKTNLLTHLIEAYPDPLSREELAERAGVSASSSGFDKNISTLKSWELVTYPGKGLVAALPVLFVEDGS